MNSNLIEELWNKANTFSIITNGNFIVDGIELGENGIPTKPDDDEVTLQLVIDFFDNSL
jgi:hypothetical protein